MYIYVNLCELTAVCLQAIHSTKVHHYNDTLNFAIGEHAESGHVMVRGFSISQIYGAYCDDGQNYKNVVGFIKVKGPSIIINLLYTKRKSFVHGWVGQGELHEKY